MLGNAAEKSHGAIMGIFSTKSHINGSTCLHLHVDHLLRGHLAFRREHESDEMVRTYWSLLHIPLSVLDQFVEVNPFWSGKVYS